MFCFQPESNIPEGQDYEKYQHYTDEQGEVLPTQHSTKTAIASKVALIDMLVRIDDDDVDELEFNDASTLLGH